MNKPLRWAGYIKPMDKMEAIRDEKNRITAIDVDLQKTHILDFAKENGFSVTEMYEDAENEDFSSDEAFAKMRNDAIYRKFDGIIIDSIFCFGMQTYAMTDLLMNTYFPAGIHFIVIEDDFRSKGRTLDEIRDYCKIASNRYRSRQALITMMKPEKERAATQKYSRSDERPPCILKMLPEYSKMVYKRGNGRKCFEDKNIQKQLHKLVLSEKKRAEYAVSKLKAAEPYKKEILSDYLYQTDLLWNQMVVLNEAFVNLHYQLQEGLISEIEYHRQYNEYMMQCDEIEGKYALYRAEMFEIERLFDTENRWIKRFITTVIPEKFTMENMMRWIQGFDIENGIVKNVVFTFWEWRDALPDICKMKEKDYGTKK